MPVTKLRFEDSRVHGFLDRFIAFVWVYIRGVAYAVFRCKNLRYLPALIAMLVMIVIYVPFIFIAALNSLSQVIACAMDICHDELFFFKLGTGLALIFLAFAPILALMFIGTYYKIGDFIAVALVNETPDTISIHGLTGSRAGAKRNHSQAPGVIDTALELAPALAEYADERQKKILINPGVLTMDQRVVSALHLVEEPGRWHANWVRYPKPLSETA